MADKIYYDEIHKVVICMKCKFALRPGQSLERHFRENDFTSGEALATIKDYIAMLTIRDPCSVDPLPDGSPKHPQLEEIENAFSCGACRFLTESKDVLTRHWRAAKHEGSVAFERVTLQSWQRGRYVRYWTMADENRSMSDGEPVSTAPSQLSEAIERLEARIKGEDAEWLRKGDAESNIDRDSQWVKEMRWVRHFGDRDKMIIYDAAEWVRSRNNPLALRVQQADEAAKVEMKMLTRLSESFQREVDRCMWRVDQVPTDSLQCLQAIDDRKNNGQPFKKPSGDGTIQTYVYVGERYLTLCWRAHQLGREQAEEQLAMFFTNEQWGLLSDVIRELEDDQLSNSPRLADSGFFDEESEQGSESGTSDGDWVNPDYRETAIMATAALDRAVFRFMVASIKVEVGGDMYRNALLCFCAAMGIRKQPLGFSEAIGYTKHLAALLWLCKLFFLEAEFEGEARDVTELRVETIKAFDAEHRRWMRAGVYTVVSKIISWMALGKGIRNTTAAAPTVRWSEDFESLFHNGEQIRIADFQRAACSIMVDADCVLDQLMAGRWKAESGKIDISRIQDSMIRLGARQSFATNELNSWLRPGSAMILQAPGAKLWDEMHSRWRVTAVKRWLKQVMRFREVLMILVHIWQGQPGRGPETTTLRHCDSWQLMRNIVIYGRHVMIITDRDKMKAIRGNGRKVARFLPEAIGKMMIAYIAWILPTERVMLQEMQVADGKTESYEYLWRSGKSEHWTTEQMSIIMCRLLRPYIGMALGTARYRIIVVEFGRRIQGLAMRQANEAAGEEDDDAGIEIDSVTGQVIDAQGSWNIVWDLQGTHGTAIARRGYALHVGMPGQLNPEMINIYREISQLWHQFLKQGNRTPVQGQKRKQRDVESDARKRKKIASAEAIAKERDEHMTKALRDLLGPRSQWRSEKQLESMRLILSLKGSQSAICILPTGAGKSILFMLPAVMYGGGTSIVVVPFISLASDLLERARSMGVDVIEFQRSEVIRHEAMPRVARLVIVSADIAVTPVFQSYVDGIGSALQRIYYDECHTAVTDSGYRRNLEKLRGLHRFMRPIVLLTATMPVTFEPWFREQMLVEDAQVVRDRTSKTNCRYVVEQVEGGRDGIERRIVELSGLIRDRMTGGQKGVIYCRSTTQCDELAAAIGCHAYHSKMSMENRVAALTAWARGSGHAWIVATSGLGTGIDIGGIVAVLHAELPYGIVDFVQQTGRGARREGEVVESIVVHDGRQPYERVGISMIEAMNMHQIYMYATTPGCRREVLSTCMDGVTGERCVDIPEAILCDHCERQETSEVEVNDKLADGQGSHRTPEHGVNRWASFSKEEGAAEVFLRKWLDKVEFSCALCDVSNTYEAREGAEPEDIHGDDNADDWCEPDIGEAYAAVRRRIRFADNSCCFHCVLPLDWCIRAKEEAGKGEGDECVYMNKVLPVVLMALDWETAIPWMWDKYQVDMKDRKAFLRWLGRRTRFHNTNGANIHILWETILQIVYKDSKL